jgi:hypothetical protein
MASEIANAARSCGMDPVVLAIKKRRVELPPHALLRRSRGVEEYVIHEPLTLRRTDFRIIGVTGKKRTFEQQISALARKLGELGKGRQ